MPAKDFKDLVAWQEAYKLTLMVYQVTKKFPKDEQYGLSNQLRRAAVSVTSNIAEGFGRSGYKEKDQFYAMAKGSLTEVENQLLIAKGIDYLNEHEYLKINNQCIQAQRLLGGLQKANKIKGIEANSKISNPASKF